MNRISSQTTAETGSTQPGQRSRSAFSLVELLVVITIVSALVTLLLPAMSSSREVAQSAVCTSRMRQMGVAITTYTVDNNSRYPYGAWRPWVAPTLTWDVLVNDQMGATGSVQSAISYNYPLLICPKDPKKPNATYGVRSYLMTGAITGGELLYVAANGPGVAPHSVGYQDVIAPAGTFLLVKAPNNTSGRGYYGCTTDTPTYQVGPLLTLTNPTHVVTGNPPYTVLGVYPEGATTHPNNTFNYLYCDGHIQAIYPLDTDTRPGILGATHSGMRSGFWFQNSSGPGNGGWTLNPND